jgi:hypothetical protein
MKITKKTAKRRYHRLLTLRLIDRCLDVATSINVNIEQSSVIKLAFNLGERYLTLLTDLKDNLTLAGKLAYGGNFSEAQVQTIILQYCPMQVTSNAINTTSSVVKAFYASLELTDEVKQTNIAKIERIYSGILDKIDRQNKTFVDGLKEIAAYKKGYRKCKKKSETTKTTYIKLLSSITSL